MHGEQLLKECFVSTRLVQRIPMCVLVSICLFSIHFCFKFFSIATFSYALQNYEIVHYRVLFFTLNSLLLPYPVEKRSNIMRTLSKELRRTIPENIKMEVIYAVTKLGSQFNINNPIPKKAPSLYNLS